jgi:hypothetical protein
MENSMSILIRVDRRKAIFRGGAWVASDRALESHLNAETERWIAETGGPPVTDSDPEATCARTIARRLNATVLRHVPSRTSKTREIFFARRQLKLGF